MQEKIKSEEISVVVQGPIDKEYTKLTLKSIRKNLPNAEIILSTWEGEILDDLDFDVLVLNKLPINVQQKAFKNKKMFSNINRMILSTNKGLEKANRKYTLKLRTDLYIDNTKFLEKFEEFPARCNKYKLFEKRIVASTMFSRYFTERNNNKKVIPFHVSDWWFFGLTSDVKKYLLSAELVEEPYFSNYFEYPENSEKTSVYEKFSWKFAPEQYLGYSCFLKYFDDIKMKDCSDYSDLINEKSQICLANNFIFLEYKYSGIRNFKYLASKNELMLGEQYLNLYTYYNFEKDYKNFCDCNYVPNGKTYIYVNTKKVHKILRLYKHIYRLVDKNGTLKDKIEQLFLGIPGSIICLIPLLFVKEQNLSND